MYHEMVYYNRMHVKIRLPQSILSKIVHKCNVLVDVRPVLYVEFRSRQMQFNNR
jgi:hypothetical protein